jgi:hypothetical protein
MKVTPIFDQAPNTTVATHGGRLGNPVEAPQQPVQPLASVEVPASSLDSNMFNVSKEMPSGLAFYPFDSLSVRPFGLLEHIKLRRAVTEENLRHQVDALSACQDHPAFDLTVGDFQFLMYWHRINDFKRTPYTVEWTCDDATHVHQTTPEYAQEYAEAQQANGQTTSDELLPKEPDSLRNIHMLTRSSMDVVLMQSEACEAFMMDFEDLYGLKLFPPMIRDVVFALEEEDLDVDLKSFNRYAGLLNPHVHGNTLAERRHALLLYTQANPGLDIIQDFERWVKISDHGVREQVAVVCKGCGSKRSLTLRVDPFTFFPSV